MATLRIEEMGTIEAPQSVNMIYKDGIVLISYYGCRDCYLLGLYDLSTGKKFQDWDIDKIALVTNEVKIIEINGPKIIEHDPVVITLPESMANLKPFAKRGIPFVANVDYDYLSPYAVFTECNLMTGELTVTQLMKGPDQTIKIVTVTLS